MSKEIFSVLEELLEVEGITEDYELNEDNWDSLCVVGFIAEANTRFQVVIDAESVAKATKVSDLIELIEK